MVIYFKSHQFQMKLGTGQKEQGTTIKEVMWLLPSLLIVFNTVPMHDRWGDRQNC